MAITKTAVDLIGTAATKQSVAAAGVVSSATRDLSGKIGLMITAAVAYGASIPGSDPLVEIFTSPDGTNMDTEAYESFYVPRLANSTKTISIPVRFAEDVKYYFVKITNGATNGISAWVATVEVGL